MKKVFKLFMFLVFSLVLAVSCEKENENENEGGNESKTSSATSSESHNMGQNCMNCHKQGGQGEGWFSIAGTVYDTSLTKVYTNATVKLYTAPNGGGTLKYTLPVDRKGNFYTTTSISFGSGLYPVVSGVNNPNYMSTPITTGDCNSCHGISTSKLWAE